MNIALVGIFLLTLLLAAVNGSNDVSKGVATLAGAGVTRYRTAVIWGTVTTFAGALLSFLFAARMTALFSKGIVTAPPTLGFAIAVLTGAIAWVGFATITRLPVSTTHALVGALIGAGIQLGPHAVNWSVLLTKVATPLLASVAVAYAISVALSFVRLPEPRCICVGVTSGAATLPANRPGGAVAFTTSGSLPMLQITTGTIAECRVHGAAVRRLGFNLTTAHWLTSGATGFARGLNDTPKIVAIGTFALAPAGVAPQALLVATALAMAAGALLAGQRVARVLGEKVVQMSHEEGFKANLTTAVLVGVGANLGLPMSTTHVSTGAIAGVAGLNRTRLNGRTLRDFAIAWTLTPLTAGLIAAGTFLLVR
ncbi:MAG: inorganic phosphate transporter [Chloroflexota bacterium]